MNRTIGFIDRGELAAVAWTFGIPHSTGYPTLMLLAGALVHLIPLRPVLVLNGFAALLVTAGAGVLTLLFYRVLRTVAGPLAPRLRATYAALAALFTALTMTWWQQANGFEVYALHTLLMPLVVLLCLRWVDVAASEVPGAASPKVRRAGFAFGLVLGLSFTNHMTTILLAPGLLGMAMMRLGAGREFRRRWIPLVPPFLLGLLPYAWLPIRSSMQPRFDWGATHTLRGFLHHVSGSDYRSWVFGDPHTTLSQLRYMSWRLPQDFAWAGIVLAAIGALLLAQRARPLATMATLFIVTGAAFASGYRIMDLDSYLLTSVFGIALLACAGLLRVHERFGGRVALALSTVLVIANLALHLDDSSEARNRMAEGLVYDQLGPLPRNAVLLTSLWDYGQAGSYYYQEVENYRRDVLVVSPELLRVSWYLDELARRAPELMQRAAPEAASYRAILTSIEHGRSHQDPAARAAHDAFVAAFAEGAMRDHPVFSTSPLTGLHPEWQRVPYHLTYWLRSDSRYVPEPPWRYRYQLWPNHVDGYVALACWFYGESRVDRAKYETAYGHPAAARRALAEAAQFDPHIRPERVGPMPLGTQDIVLRTARFFRTLGRPVEAGSAAR